MRNLNSGKRINRLKLLLLLPLSILLVITAVTFLSIPVKTSASHSQVDLLTTDNFAILGGSAISDTGTSTITGDAGLSPTGGASITGLTCAEMTGTIYDNDAGYSGGGGGSTACLVTNAGLLTTAKASLVTAYNDAAGRTTTSTIPTDLAGTTLTDGTYDSASGTFEILGGGTVTLNGEGNANAVFIFKMATTLVTSSSSQVLLTNGAQACNVFWQVGSSATLGTSSNFTGNILALTSITDDGGSTVNGRLLARNGAVTLNNTTVTKQNCATPTATPTPTVTPTPTPSSSSTSSSTSASGVPASCPTSGITTVPTITEAIRVSPTSVSLSWGPDAGLKDFVVQYGFQNGDWQFSTNVSGFSTTLGNLPVNQPLWVRVAATDGCIVGTYSLPVLVGGTPGVGSGNPLIPLFPETGIAPDDSRNLLIALSLLFGISSFLLVRKVSKYFSNQ